MGRRWLGYNKPGLLPGPGDGQSASGPAIAGGAVDGAGGLADLT